MRRGRRAAVLGGEESRGLVGKRDRDRGAGGVPACVGERLLHDPERRQRDGVRQARGAVPSSWRFDVQARPRGARATSSGRSSTPGRGGGGGVEQVAVAQHAEDGAQLADRVVAGVLDRLERGAGVAGVASSSSAAAAAWTLIVVRVCATTSCRSRAIRMPLLLGAPLGLLLARALGELEPLLEQLEVARVASGELGDQQRDRHEQHVAERLQQAGPAGVQRADGADRDDRHDRGQGAFARPRRSASE